MIHRNIVHVQGPPGAGKTSFVEALLGRLEHLVTCVGAERDDSLSGPVESARTRTADLRRFAGAAACCVAHYRFPASRKKGSTRSNRRWSITSSCRGIEQAQLVVVSARDESDMQRGESMLEEVARLRKDEAVFADVMGFRGTRVPITSVVARLLDPADPGLKKAVARVKRAL